MGSKKRRPKHGKGSNYERKFSKDLSLWWTHGERNNVFWRTSMSGGRMTVRARKGEDTRHHCGDIAAIDPVGQPLTELITIECKCGYNGETILGLLDRAVGRPMYRDWIKQAKTAASYAGTPHWIIVHKRNSRHPLVTMNYELWQELKSLGCFQNTMDPGLGIQIGKNRYTVVRLSEFLHSVTPEIIVAARDRERHHAKLRAEREAAHARAEAARQRRA